MTTLIPIFADHLSHDLSALQFADKAAARILMVEVRDEADTVPHHRKKLIFLFSAMRHFAAALRDDGWQVDYVMLTDPDNRQSFTAEVGRALDRHDIADIMVCQPGNWRVQEVVKSWEEMFDRRVTITLDDRFISTPDEFADWAEGRKQLRMEYFYRDMRRKTGLLMDGETPEGGQWNYDKENRKPPKGGMDYPDAPKYPPDAITASVIDMIRAEFPDRFGSDEAFDWAVTRDDALTALQHFIDNRLNCFGDFQDAMVVGEPFMFHSLIGFYLNSGLLRPLEVCRAVEAAYRAGKAPLNAAEGYIRQIIGWREYVRGIYFLKMPDYIDENFFGNRRYLPDFYWTGETDMNCLSQTIGQTIDHAYAHHIQRLMVTGNFALIAGIDPFKVHEWYLAVYADAFEWVELPNTLGMSQFGDGGLLGSKPYAASGSYINRMSDYCKDCRYKVSKRIEADACPFNSLYWDFHMRNEDRLRGNPRLNMVYRNLDRMDDETKAALRARADDVLKSLTPSHAEDYL
ncbi:cryptochrome/photolyase family protein [Algimonas porphyrae]|uniref:(6-4) photolyase n=1 Tax=Algimonas porphyrae TaxID=1128113 RepID=A0ABQ5V3F5_9PROT|nr:cryptochrome/photolyase family protein [Algimonas porphyrae]GLQ22036.1 (6-4) photolyase [Algimonas porphyrae]